MARPPPVPLQVSSVERVAQRASRIVFDGTPPVQSHLPASSMSLWFSDPSRRGDDRGRSGRSDKRTFTPRSIDERGASLMVEFVLHGSGPASTWAETASRGSVLWSGPIKGGYRVPPPRSHLVLVGDDTAIAAIGTIVEAIDPSVRTTVVIEVIDGRDERAVSSERVVDPIWLHRGDDSDQAGILTLNLLETLEVPHDSYWWIAGEREAIRAMRDELLGDARTTRDRLSLNAYWRLRPVDPRQEQGNSSQGER